MIAFRSNNSEGHSIMGWQDQCQRTPVGCFFPESE